MIDNYEKARKLINEYRSTCLWFIRKDFVAKGNGALIFLLTYIEKYGDSRAYKEARELKTWLLRKSKKKSVN